MGVKMNMEVPLGLSVLDLCLAVSFGIFYNTAHLFRTHTFCLGVGMTGKVMLSMERRFRRAFRFSVFLC